MSERTPSPSRYPYRRILTTLAGARAFKGVLIALGVGAACLAVAAAGVPFEVTAQGSGNGQPSGDEDVKEMNKAFADYIESLKDLQKSFIAADAFRLDEAHAVGAYDLITAFMHSANRQNLTSSGAGLRGYPRFTGFDDPDTRIGVDNPDTQYMGAIVNNEDCDQVWRITGNRSNSVDFILTTFDTSGGTGGGPTLEDEDMYNENGDPLGLDEDFVAYAACEDPGLGPNFLELPQGRTIQIARRHSHCDWSVERPAEIHIERMATIGVPSNPLSAEVMTEQIRQGIALNETQAPFWPAFVDTIKQAPVNTALPWRPTGGLGITTQYSMLMWWELADDEALIIRLPDIPSSDPNLDGIAKYYGLQLSNFWASSADWANRHASMNWGLDGGCQAEKAAFPTPHPAQEKWDEAEEPNPWPDCGFQDAYYIVLSKQDPGVRNWIETAELSQGILAGRLQSVAPIDVPTVLGTPLLPAPATGANSCMLPIAFPPMPVNQVAPFLQSFGAASPGFTSADRTDQLLVRQNFARQKYVFW
jgi:hypothetical protein